MKLVKYVHPAAPVIKLKQKSANMLVELCHEMITVAKSKDKLVFDQDIPC